jgi:hypothetical protein
MAKDHGKPVLKSRHRIKNSNGGIMPFNHHLSGEFYTTCKKSSQQNVVMVDRYLRPDYPDPEKYRDDGKEHYKKSRYIINGGLLKKPHKGDRKYYNQPNTASLIPDCVPYDES